MRGAGRPHPGHHRARARGLDPAERRRRARRLRAPLEALAVRYGPAFLPTDPLELVVSLRGRRNREVGGFLAAGLAHGRVAAIRASLVDLWARMGGQPGRFTLEFDPARDGPRLSGWRYRWTGGRDLGNLLLSLRRLLRRHGSLEAALAARLRTDHPDVGPALAGFSSEGLSLLPEGAGRGARWFFATPAKGGACKRLLLWLRWMVRREGVDLGLWSRIPPSALVLPLDTHLARIVRYAGLTDYRGAGWRSAEDATRTLRLLDPEDPVRYDFALSRLGIVGDCRHRRDAAVCSSCPIEGICRL